MMFDVTRRAFLRSSGCGAAAAAAVHTAAAQTAVKSTGASATNSVKIIGICCSPRKGKTTAAALGVCLEAAQKVDPRIEVELIELADMKIDGSLACGRQPDPGQRDDFHRLIPKLETPRVGGIIVGTPVYFGTMTSLCKAFLDRCIVFRKKKFALRNKVAGVLAVGGARNGGQELTIQSVQTALLCQEMILVGDGQPTAHFGATVWNNGKDSVTEDAFGMATTKNLGRRVAELALRLV